MHYNVGFLNLSFKQCVAMQTEKGHKNFWLTTFSTRKFLLVLFFRSCPTRSRPINHKLSCNNSSSTINFNKEPRIKKTKNLYIIYVLRLREWIYCLWGRLYQYNFSWFPENGSFSVHSLNERNLYIPKYAGNLKELFSGNTHITNF